MEERGKKWRRRCGSAGNASRGSEEDAAMGGGGGVAAVCRETPQTHSWDAGRLERGARVRLEKGGPVESSCRVVVGG